MKRSKILAVGGMIVISVVMLSCREESLPGTLDLAGSVAGTYKGTITDSGSGNVYEATADIIKSGDNIIEIHCNSDVLDSTFVMEVFDDGDSLMLCNIGDDFMRQYGHVRMNEHHNMMGGDSKGQDREHHMDEEHGRDDEHFGGFNMKDHSFSYRFEKEEGRGEHTLEFKGKKQQ